jgi:hypothetical protein
VTASARRVQRRQKRRRENQRLADEVMHLSGGVNGIAIRARRHGATEVSVALYEGKRSYSPASITSRVRTLAEMTPEEQAAMRQLYDRPQRGSK